MCLIALLFEPSSETPLTVLANRDEFYRRRAAPLSWWKNTPILAGKDLGYRSWWTPWAKPTLGLGTWLGVNRSGRFAALTNVREPYVTTYQTKSRGLLVSRFLSENIPELKYAEELQKSASQYAGYNLLFGSAQKLYYFSNRNDTTLQTVEPGLHALSNAALDTPWYKVKKILWDLSQFKNPILVSEALALMSDGKPAPESEVQQTGMPLAIERGLSPPFIRLPGYGTRVTSFLQFTKNGRIHFHERTFKRGKFKKDVSFEYSDSSITEHSGLT